MLDILPGIDEWIQQKKPFALATVIHTWGSSPRPIGSAMAVSGEMEMVGSVSGGCVEGVVVLEAVEVLKSGKPRHLQFGVSDEDAWSVGLSCGGKLDVFVEKFLAFNEQEDEKAIWKKLRTAVRNNSGCVLLNNLSENQSRHFLVHAGGEVVGVSLPSSLKEKALQAFRERKNQIIEEEGMEWFAQVFPRKNQLFIVGAAHITVDLVALANPFGFETIVIDPRGVFANKTQFPVPPDQLFANWPEEVLPEFTFDASSFAVVLSHDPKIDDPALHLLLKSQVAYIGALGSSRTHAKRRARLQKAGFSDEDIQRIHGPIGLNIHAKTAKEIALSIMAEIISVKNAYL